MNFVEEIQELVTDVPKDCILRKPKQVHGALTELIKRRFNVTIAFDDSSELYTSVLIRSDEEKQFFILDGLRPESGHQHAANQERFTLRTNMQGVEIIALNNRISGLGKHGDHAIYKVPFPTELVYIQRRNAFRVYLRRSMGARARMKAIGRPEPIFGEILDLSATGMKVRVEGMLDPPAENNEVFHQLYVEIPDKGDFDCRAILRHAAFNRKQQATMCGIEFCELDGRTSQRIAMLVNEIERVNRREMARLER